MLYLKKIDIEIEQNIQSSLSNEITKEKKYAFTLHGFLKKRYVSICFNFKLLKVQLRLLQNINNSLCDKIIIPCFYLHK